MGAVWYNGLRFQILLFLTLALFPLGAVAIYQTTRVANEAASNAELALLAMTERAAQSEERIIERALGAAMFFASVVPDFLENPETCTAHLSDFVRNDEAFSFIGVLPQSGLMTCSSAGRPFDFSNYPGYAANLAAQRRSIGVNKDGPLSGQSVFVISEPYRINGAFAGYIAVSVPHAELMGMSGEFTDLGLKELITFNSDGVILTARTDLDVAQAEVPVNRPLDSLASAQAVAFKGETSSGALRTYTVVPIKGTPAYVMGVWDNSNAMANKLAALIRPALFPVLMWMASMAVAMLAIHTLVLRHISRLRRDMDNFGDNRMIRDDGPAFSMPNELQALSNNFLRMTHDILQDEAELENALRTKNVLIKEVHHRVKNNLQLISSIMNMQIRTARHDETKTVLSRLQDRVLSLATIHRDLYQSQHGGRVDVGALIAEVIEKSLEVGLYRDHTAKVETDIDPVLLYPDQAVPLSLMMAEATTNTLKYLGAQPGQKRWIKVALKQDGSDCNLTVANSVGAIGEVESTGLGSQLLNAFAIQLGGQIKVENRPDQYVLQVHFTIAEFQPEERDF